jgi:hypothetical protein
MNINVQSAKKKLSNLIETEFERLYARLTENNEAGLGNLFENVRNMHVTNNSVDKVERENIKLLLNQGFEYLDKLINNKFEVAKKDIDMKLLTIDNNAHVIYQIVEESIKSIV